MATVLTHQIEPGILYSHHPDHRNGTARKSQWIIPEHDERVCFSTARTRGWTSEGVGWGLHLPNARVEYLGIDDGGEYSLFIAKFVDGNKNGQWHGYPGDPQRHAADIPSPDVLRSWLHCELLSAAKIRKIARGQPCNL